jgi:hypothetical protein
LIRNYSQIIRLIFADLLLKFACWWRKRQNSTRIEHDDEEANMNIFANNCCWNTAGSTDAWRLQQPTAGRLLQEGIIIISFISFLRDSIDISIMNVPLAHSIVSQAPVVLTLLSWSW